MAATVCAAALALVAAAPLPALACGHCIEDRIAAVYDYAVVMRAFDRNHKVAFFAIDGVLAAQDAAAIREIAKTIRGIDTSSVRVSAELASMSFAFGPRQSLAGVQERIERRLRSRGLALLPLRVMDRQAAAGR